MVYIISIRIHGIEISLVIYAHFFAHCVSNDFLDFTLITK